MLQISSYQMIFGSQSVEELLSQYHGHLNCCHHHCLAIPHTLDSSRLQNLHLSWLNCIDCRIEIPWIVVENAVTIIEIVMDKLVLP